MRCNRAIGSGLFAIFSIVGQAQNVSWVGVISTKQCRKVSESDRATCVAESLRKKSQVPLFVVEGNVYQLTGIPDIQQYLKGRILVSGRLTNRVIAVSSIQDASAPVPAMSAPAQHAVTGTRIFSGEAPGREAGRISKVAPMAVDTVIGQEKRGDSEALIIGQLRADNKAVDLTPDDMVRLKEAGVSERIIAVLMDPRSDAPSSPAPAALPSGPKRRVVIEAFDFSTVRNSVKAIFGTDADIGQGLRAMLIEKLSHQSDIVLLERERVKTLMAEQDLGATNRVKQGTDARIGRITGADALVAGDIVVFGRDDANTGKIGGAVGGTFGGGIRGLGGTAKPVKAVVSVNYRFVDADTGEVIATGEARGESHRTGSNLLGSSANLKTPGHFDMGSSNFSETIIGEAVQDCVNKLAAAVVQGVEGMKPAIREVDATVADVSGLTMIINAGFDEGVAVGDVFEIFSVDREIKDPDTKEVIDRTLTKVGDFTVESVRDKVASGKYAGSAAQVGFVARRKTPR